MADSKYAVPAEEILDPAPLSVAALKSGLGLTTEELGAAAGRSSRSAARWIAGEDPLPSRGGSARTLRRLAYLDTLLADVVGESRRADWLRTPNPGLRGEAPVDLITSGRTEDLIGVVLTLAEGFLG